MCGHYIYEQCLRGSEMCVLCHHSSWSCIIAAPWASGRPTRQGVLTTASAIQAGVILVRCPDVHKQCRREFCGRLK